MDSQLPRISLFRPAIGPAEEAAVLRVLRSGWLGRGPEVAAFEREFAEAVGARYCVATNSCTSALQMALMLHGVGPGDEVIVPTMTFVSTAHSVCAVGAKPVFCDVGDDTVCASPKSVAIKMSVKTAAVIVVLYGGLATDLISLRAAIGTCGIPIIFDCAHAAGAQYRNEKIGSLGTCCWSFQAVKHLCAGDGGAVTMQDDQMAERAQRLAWLGIDRSTYARTGERGYDWDYSCEEIGGKWHMNDLAAALARVQLARLPELLACRRRIASRYTEAGIPHVQIDSPGHSWHLFVTRHPRRDALMSHLRERGIATGVHYRPIHTHPCYGYQPALPTAERLFKEIVSLPMHPGLTDADVDRIITAIKEFGA